MHVKSEANSTIIIEKSKFIAYVNKCTNEDEYKEYIKSIKKRYYDATHICSACIINDIKRSNDDGEPSGSAGIPILKVLESNNLNNTTALVIRYYGGIKLGVGGLARAYGKAVTECLKIAQKAEYCEYNKYEITLPYNLSNKINHLITKEAINIKKEYKENVKYSYLTNKDSDLNNKIIELSSGIQPILLGKEIIEKVI